MSSTHLVSETFAANLARRIRQLRGCDDVTTDTCLDAIRDGLQDTPPLHVDDFKKSALPYPLSEAIPTQDIARKHLDVARQGKATAGDLARLYARAYSAILLADGMAADEWTRCMQIAGAIIRSRFRAHIVLPDDLGPGDELISVLGAGAGHTDAVRIRHRTDRNTFAVDAERRPGVDDAVTFKTFSDRDILVLVKRPH